MQYFGWYSFTAAHRGHPAILAPLVTNFISTIFNLSSIDTEFFISDMKVVTSELEFSSRQTDEYFVTRLRDS